MLMLYVAFCGLLLLALALLSHRAKAERYCLMILCFLMTADDKCTFQPLFGTVFQPLLGTDWLKLMSPHCVCVLR